MPHIGRKPAGGPPRINWHHPHAQGLVLYVVFWEGGGLTTYDLVSGKPGTLTSSPTWSRDRQGNGGYAMTFANGSSNYVDFGTTAPSLNMDVPGSMGVCCSVYYPTKPNFSNFILGSKGSQWTLDVEGPSNTGRFYINGGGSGALWAMGRTMIDGDRLTIGGSWNFGTTTGYVASEGRVYSSSSAPFASIPSSATSTRIAISGSGTSGLTGDIGFMALWNRAVPEQVMTEFQRRPYACIKGFTPAIFGSPGAAPPASNIWMLFTEFPTLGYVEG